ncbi:MFS transporter [Streptomyces durocortorensis]|uniref:MFS transporter n=1 Tax=Streptomyces durocortorensis TaxID=2811104 RepID=A0ABS2HYH7_9ACTN|nr:MFS transporter [Streptomyces durocortorensis]MBM7054573.1 MFS transporter [Streptomyces durocortorensis]
MTSYGTAAPALPAYRDMNVLRWLAAHTASVTGDVVYFLALSWSATRAAGPSQVGLVIAAGALPRAVLMLGGGVVADRFGPRRCCRRRRRDALRDGLSYIRRHRMLAPLITVIGLSEMCFSGPVAAGLVLLADERGWGAAGMGWIASAFSVGAAAAALLLAVRARVPRAGPAMSGALLVTAVGAVALGHTRPLPYAVAFGALIGLTNGVTAAVTGALVQTETEPRYLGRVTSVTTLCALGLAPILFPVVGITVAVWGAAMFFTVCGGICLLAAVFGIAVPVLLRAELREPGPAPSLPPLHSPPPSTSTSTEQ